MADSKTAPASPPAISSKQRSLLIAAAKKLVEDNRITVCAMDQTIGFKGKTCPTVNCYQRGSHGECVAGQLEEAKPSSKLTRDTITVVEIIEAARNAPSYAQYTPITSTGDARYDLFIQEAEIDRAKLQFVLDHNAMWANLITSIIRAQE